MVEERGYERRVAPGGPAPVVLRSAESFGAGVGRAVEQAGETAHQLQLRSYKLDRQENADSEAADFASKFARVRSDMDVATREARANAAAGGKGHSAAMQKRLDEQREALLGGITEDNVRRSAEAQFTEYGGRFIKAEGDFEEGRRVDKLVTDVGDAVDMGRNRIRISKGDAAVYAEELEQQVSAIYALGGVGEDVKDGLAREAEQKLSVGFLQGMMDERPAEAKDAIMAGQFNDIFSGEQLDALMNGADVEIRRVEEKAQREAAAQEAAFNKSVRIAKERDEQGLEIDDEALASLEAAAVLLGKEDVALQISGMRANGEFVRVWESATPVRREQRLSVLLEKDKPTDNDKREIKWLQGPGKALDTADRNDPFSAVQRKFPNLAPPAVDLSNAASVKARMEWQREASDAMKDPVPFFSQNELADIRADYRNGEGGQAAVLAQLDAVPATGGARALVAREIAPTDRPFQILAQLAPDFRRMAINGKKVLTAKGGSWFVPSKDNRKRPDIIEMFDGVNNELAYAMRAFPGEAAEIQKVAIQIASGALAGEGGDGDNLNSTIYRKAVRAALGGKGGTGGLGVWNRGAFVIADGFTPGGFEAAVMLDVARKSNRPRGQANPPVNPDGSVFELKRATPVFIGTDARGVSRYHWEVGSEQVKAKDGRAYVTEVVAGR